MEPNSIPSWMMVGVPFDTSSSSTTTTWVLKPSSGRLETPWERILRVATEVLRESYPQVMETSEEYAATMLNVITELMADVPPPLFNETMDATNDGAE